jgi:hypothetical protein
MFRKLMVSLLFLSVVTPATNAIAQSGKIAMLFNLGTLPVKLSVTDCMGRAQALFKAKGFSFAGNNVSIEGASPKGPEKVLVECVSVSKEMTRVLVLVAGLEDAGVKSLYEEVKSAVLK